MSRRALGGVMLADTESEFKDATYIADISSGDLYPNFQGNGGIRSNH